MGNKPLKKKATIIFLFLLLAGLLVINYFTVRNISTAIASTNWPTTDGWVVTSRVATGSDMGGGVELYTEVTYRYTVNGIEYVSTVGLGNKPVDQVPPGHHLTVFYNPNSPDQGVLVTGFDSVGEEVCFLSLSFFWVLILILIIILIIRSHP